MSTEADLRAVLLAHAPLLAVVPAARISIDAVAPGTTTPYIAFSKQTNSPSFGLDDTLLAQVTTIDIQCVGGSPGLGGRATALSVSDLVKDALLAGHQPWAGETTAYDDALDVEVEVVTVDWLSS